MSFSTLRRNLIWSRLPFKKRFVFFETGSVSNSSSIRLFKNDYEFPGIQSSAIVGSDCKQSCRLNVPTCSSSSPCSKRSHDHRISPSKHYFSSPYSKRSHQMNLKRSCEMKLPVILPSHSCKTWCDKNFPSSQRRLPLRLP